MTSQDDDVHILCLHGSGSNPTIYDAQLRKLFASELKISETLTAKFVIHHIRGFYECDLHPSLVPYFKGDPGFRYLERTVDGVYTEKGLERGMAIMEKEVQRVSAEIRRCRRSGTETDTAADDETETMKGVPWDGIVAFSQGAVTALVYACTRPSSSLSSSSSSSSSPPPPPSSLLPVDFTMPFIVSMSAPNGWHAWVRRKLLMEPSTTTTTAQGVISKLCRWPVLHTYGMRDDPRMTQSDNDAFFVPVANHCYAHEEGHRPYPGDKAAADAMNQVVVDFITACVRKRRMIDVHI